MVAIVPLGLRKYSQIFIVDEHSEIVLHPSVGKSSMNRTSLDPYRWLSLAHSRPETRLACVNSPRAVVKQLKLQGAAFKAFECVRKLN